MKSSIPYRSTAAPGKATRQAGLTMIELLIGLVIVAILTSLASPGFRGTLENYRLSAASDNILSALQLARSEALGRGLATSLCASNNQVSCSGTWNDGWIVFVDQNSDGSFTAGTDTLLQTHAQDNQHATISLLGAVTSHVRFNSEGRAAERATFQVCRPGSGAQHDSDALGVIIDFSGSLRGAQDTNADGIRESHLDTNLSC